MKIEEPRVGLLNAARRIREHNRIHHAVERNSPLITEILDFAANLIELHANGEAALVKHGEWLPCIDINIRYIGVFQCSECLYRVRSQWSTHCNYNYCPCCGAKMDSGGTKREDRRKQVK